LFEEWRLKMILKEMKCQDRKAVAGGDIAAKYLYALQCSDPEEKRRWLKIRDALRRSQ